MHLFVHSLELAVALQSDSHYYSLMHILKINPNFYEAHPTRQEVFVKIKQNKIQSESVTNLSLTTFQTCERFILASDLAGSYKQRAECAIFLKAVQCFKIV